MNQGSWLKGTILFIILLLLGFSVFLYFFLFRYNPYEFQATKPPIPTINQDEYQKIAP